MKMLATGAVFANEVWIGNLLPLAPTQLAESVTCAIAVNTPGVTLWSRKPFERHASCEFENPLTWRFDETDSMVMCENVKVPWERVFVHMDAILAREIYIKTPGHCYGNHQSNVRFHEKMKLIVGLASKVAHASGANEVPAVREVLGRFAALEAALGGMIAGQLQDAEDWPAGTCSTRSSMPVPRSSCATTASAKRRGRISIAWSTTSWRATTSRPRPRKSLRGRSREGVRAARHRRLDRARRGGVEEAHPRA